MKTKAQLILLSTLVLAGCSNEQADKTTTTTATEVKDTATATKRYVVENKDEFVASMNKQLQNLDAKISALGKKSGEYKDDAKVQADKALASLRGQREAVQAQFEKVKQAGGEAWNGARAGFSSAMT